MFGPRQPALAPPQEAWKTSPFAPRPFAAARGIIQRLHLVDEGGKLRAAKKSRETGVVIDTESIAPFERMQYLARLKGEKNDLLARQLQAEIDAKPSSGGRELTDLDQVFALDKILDTAEKAVKASQAPDKEALRGVRARLQDALTLLGSVLDPGEADLYRDTVADYSKRLAALDKSLKLDDEGAGGLDLTLQPEDIARYRADIRTTAMWGGVAEANAAATFLGAQADIYRLVPQVGGPRIFRRVMTLGAGNRTGYDLLHLGNHYVAVQGAQDGAAEDTVERRIETQPDGNCLFEAVYIVATRKPLDPRKRDRYLDTIRRTVARRITDDAVRTTLIAILSQGDTGGLGPNTARLVASKQQQARIHQMDDKSLRKRAADLDKELEGHEDYDYSAKIETFLAERVKSQSSEKTAAALLDLEESLRRAEQALRRQKFLEGAKSGAVHLGTDWWKAILANTDRDELSRSGLGRIAAMVEAYNAQVGKGADIGLLLEAIAGIELVLKDIEAPNGPLDIVREDRRDQVKALVYAFETQELRIARSTLVRLYQVAEGSQYRVGVPLGRTDLHYDFYGEGEDVGQGQRSSVVPKGFNKKEEALVTSMAPRKDPLGVNEGVTAVALQRAHPDLFSKIKRAERREADLGITHDVEYFDNLGRPWDQKAPRSHSAEEDPVSDWYNSIVKQLAKTFPQDGTGGKYKKALVKLPVGVVLDCSYMTYHDYVRLWSRLIQSADRKTLRERLIEINAPYADDDRSTRKNKSKQSTNTTLLDGCRTNGDAEAADGFLYTVSVPGLEELMPGFGAHLRKIRGKDEETIEGFANKAHPVYRNHGSPLPDAGSYFLEFYANSTAAFPSGTDIRIVYDRPNDRFYITGTHYKVWMSPYDAKIRNPFYRIDF